MWRGWETFPACETELKAVECAHDVSVVVFLVLDERNGGHWVVLVQERTLSNVTDDDCGRIPLRSNRVEDGKHDLRVTEVCIDAEVTIRTNSSFPASRDYRKLSVELEAV